jgi:SAM-dependent methyltransferase
VSRSTAPLAPQFADFARLEEGPVADVGCGPGALTAVLVERYGAAEVAAVDPSQPFVSAVRERHPGVRVLLAAAEDLPFDDGEFAATRAQLVVHFMTDAVAGIREMARVTRAGGVVAACVWDLAGTGGPLGTFWEAARQLDPDVVDESRLAGVRRGHLVELFRAAGLRDVEDGSASVSVEHPSFDDWWEPFTLGVGPAGVHVARLDDHDRMLLRDRCRELLPSAPFTVTARAWAARGSV